MQESDVQAILSEAQQGLEELKKFSDTPIPKSMAEAVEKGIDIAIETAEGALLIAYDPERRAQDRKRVIRLDHALTLLQEMEDEYLKNTVEGTLRALWGFFTWRRQLFLDVFRAVWAGILALDVELVRQAILHFWRTILREWLNVVALAEIQKPLREVLLLRHKYDLLARSKALKQRNVKRVWRRKRTRS